MTATDNGSDEERHLAGASALLRGSQSYAIDPSAPGLRQAAFWVYMRQCLYNACVNQQPPNVDLDHVLSPVPVARPNNPSSEVCSETGWANTMTWICATVISFAFGQGFQEPSARMRKWNELCAAVEGWMHDRPEVFDPIWYEQPIRGGSDPFPSVWFTADWHGMIKLQACHESRAF